MTGGWVGTQYYTLENWYEPDGNLHYEGVPVFVGSVPGCGSGSFALRETKGVLKTFETDPQTQQTPGFNEWEVLPWTATGSLKGRLLGGHGVNHWHAYLTNFNPETAQEDFGQGRFTGTITCRVSG
jgi:hypothetical protein